MWRLIMLVSLLCCIPEASDEDKVECPGGVEDGVRTVLALSIVANLPSGPLPQVVPPLSPLLNSVISNEKPENAKKTIFKKKVKLEDKVTCRNENNEEVDWFIIYKAPRLKPLSGLEYIYIDSTQDEPSYHYNISKHKLINHTKGVLANTLKPIFVQTTLPSPNFAFISYSDGTPDRYLAASDTFGHSKGVVMKNSTTVVWLVHSTPRFPYRRNAETFYPDTGKTYAQTFLCVTFNDDQFDQITDHLLYIRAYPFDHHNMDDLLYHLKKRRYDPPASYQTLTSAGGREFRSFAKQQSEEREEGDLYVTIANQLWSHVYVQTWGGQPRREDSYCPQNRPRVYNIDSVTTPLGEAGEWVTWENGNDHSKWCVTRTSDRNNRWTCIADSNRAPTQFKRRGGALCIQDVNAGDVVDGVTADKTVKVWKMFNGFIAAYEGCPVKKKHNVKYRC